MIQKPMFPEPEFPEAKFPESTHVGRSEPPLKRVWPAGLLIPALFVTQLVVQSIVLLGTLFAIHGELTLNEDKLTAQIAELAMEPLGIVVLLLPGQLIFLAFALGPALFSSEPWLRRVGLERPQIGIGELLLCILAIPAVQSLNILTLPLFEGTSDQLEMLLNMFQRSSTGMFIAIVAAYSLLPGCCEELFFRGYFLRRFAQRSSRAAIVGFFLSAFFFAGVHFDPQHAVGVLPIGFWFAYVAWRSGSVIPAIVCHIANNLYGIISARFATEEELAMVDVQLGPMDSAILGASVVCLIASVVLLGRRRGWVPEAQG